MASPREFVASFTRTLDLFRDPGAKEEQNTQFRALASLLKAATVTLVMREGRLVVDGTILDGNTLLQLHFFRSAIEIFIPSNPPILDAFVHLTSLLSHPSDE